jgi:hypothetical protein
MRANEPGRMSATSLSVSHGGVSQTTDRAALESGSLQQLAESAVRTQRIERGICLGIQGQGIVCIVRFAQPLDGLAILSQANTNQRQADWRNVLYLRTALQILQQTLPCFAMPGPR